MEVKDETEEDEEIRGTDLRRWEQMGKMFQQEKTRCFSAGF